MNRFDSDFHKELRNVISMMDSPNFDIIAYANSECVRSAGGNQVKKDIKQSLAAGYGEKKIRASLLCCRGYDDVVGIDEAMNRYKKDKSRSIPMHLSIKERNCFNDYQSQRGVTVVNRLRKKLADKKRKAAVEEIIRKAIDDEMCKQL